MFQASISPDAYRQAARRIRARLAHRPGARFEALRSLSQSYDQATTASAPPDRPSSGEAFSSLVIDHLDGNVLRFSVRQRLLRHATRMGIGRFEANLLIALVEHRHRNSPQTTPAPRANRWTPWLTFAAIQTTLVAAAWLAIG